MKKKIVFGVIMSFALLGLFRISYAEATLPFDINASVDVPQICNVTDTDGVVHIYTASDSNAYIAICAVQAGINAGTISGVKFSNAFPDLGLFVTTVNDVTADSSSQYWALYQNTVFANAGLSTLTVTTGDTIKLSLHDFSDVDLGNTLSISINSLIQPTPPTPEPEPPHTSSASGSRIVKIKTKAVFDLQKAIDFIISTQKKDGSFGEDLYTDWATISLASLESQNQKTEPIEKLTKYLLENKISGTSLTDTERHAMAMMTLGLNPYDTNGENYIEKIVSTFDGKQFGDKEEDNDDIFALIVLQNASFTSDEKIINNTINFVLSKQNENGSWNNSVDMTGASIEALAFFSSTPGVKESLEKGKKFLQESQKDNGGWNDSASSTAWALEGILALGEKPEAWIKNGNTPADFLSTKQDIDGGIKNENMDNKLWETAYVVSTLSGKTWDQIMQKFEKPQEFITIQEQETLNAKLDKILALLEKKEIPKIDTTKDTTQNKKTVSTSEKEKIENLSIQNTATIINSLEQENNTPKNEWFKNILNKIFSIF